jgi:phosphoenolpyruvate carboxylase
MNENYGKSETAGAPRALIAGTSVREAASLLFGLLLDVARRHRPEVETVLEGRAIISDLTPESLARAL